MTDVPVSKYIHLVESLYRKTVARSIDWKHYSSHDRSFIAKLGQNSVCIGVDSEDRDGEADIFIVIMNSSDSIVDRFTDVDISDHTPTIPDYEYYYPLMKEMHRLAARQASGADSVLDDILESLDDPFRDL